MANDPTKMTKAELIALVQKLQSNEPAPADVPAESKSEAATGAVSADVTELLDQNQRLVTALIAERMANAPRPASDPTIHRVENVCGATIAFALVDERTGASRHFSLERRGDAVKLTDDQFEQLKTKYKSYFDRGYIAVPGVADNPNVIRDIPAFIEALSYNDIIPRVEAITSLATLQDLFQYIESLRFVSTDANGRPLVEKDPSTGQDRPRIEERPLDAKTLALELAVQRRLYALSGMRVKLDG